MTYHFRPRYQARVEHAEPDRRRSAAAEEQAVAGHPPVQRRPPQVHWDTTALLDALVEEYQRDRAF